MARNVIVTGANRGIGKAIVEAFVQNGDNVWACCRHKTEEMLNWANTLRLGEQWIKIIEFDLKDEFAISQGFKQILADKKSIDVLVNVAGIGHMGLFQMAKFSDIRNIYEVNLFALMEMCQLVIRPMSRQKSGIIINISSTAAKEVYVGNSIYGASKAAVVAFTSSLAAELAPLGIRVNSIAPGLTETDMSSIFEADNPELPLERSALGRKILPGEIADAVVELTCDKLRMINGQMICVNGGNK